MPDGSFWLQWLLFIPLFVVINLVAAVPGRSDLREVVRVGMRHAIVGAVTLIVVSFVLYFLMGWVIGTQPWW